MASEFGGAKPALRQAARAISRGQASPPLRRTAERPAARVAPPATQFPEIDCIRHRLPVGVIAAAERRAREIGVGAERVLITSRMVDEDVYVETLARSLGVPFEPLTAVTRASCPLNDDQLVSAAAAGLLPLRLGAELAYVVAPRNQAARRLCMLARSGHLPPRIRLTSTARLQRFAERHAAGALGQQAAEALRTARPEFSAAPRGARSWLPWAIISLAYAAAVFAAPAIATMVTGVSLSIVFLAWTALRMMGLLTEEVPHRRLARQPSDKLPVYTIIVALYREVAVVNRLIAALDALDYPPEKLDVKLVVEADDFATRAALNALRLSPPYEIVVAPQVGPRTKPKALNVALALARGAFTAVFDAEDRPEPEQLRRALDMFQQHGRRLACVQAQLSIDNTADGWLARGIMAQTPQGAESDRPGGLGRLIYIAMC